MTIQLTSQQARIIQQQVEAGRYSSPNEVIERALDVLVTRDRQIEIRLRSLPNIEERLRLLEERVGAIERHRLGSRQ